jgi:tripartite motif-containing protein 71
MSRITAFFKSYSWLILIVVALFLYFALLSPASIHKVKFPLLPKVILMAEYDLSSFGIVEPAGFVVDKQGNFYFGDKANNQIYKFSTDGKFLLKWGGQKEVDGHLEIIGMLAYDGKDNIVILDDPDERGIQHVRRFDTNGNFINKWEFANGNDIFDFTVDNEGNVYLSLVGGGRCSSRDEIAKYDINGNRLKNKPSPFFYNVSHLGMDEQQEIYVLTISYSCAVGAGRVNSSGFKIEEATAYNNKRHVSVHKGYEGTVSIGGFVVDSNQNIYVSERVASGANNNLIIQNQIAKYAKNGQELLRWGSEGEGYGQFSGLAEISVDAQGIVFTFSGRRVQKWRML